MTITSYKNNWRLLLLGPLLVTGSACTTVEKSPLEPKTSQVLTAPSQVKSSETLESASVEIAKSAYLRGDFETAERHYRALLHQRPIDSKLVYNLSMVQLAQAHEGLRLYLSIEREPERLLYAQRLLKTLSTLANQ